ncbi:DNA methylase [Lachnospiraceae bacterium C1.1]|nr:DNA methylase [Lachnospiraceae bacterium C1.1]
MNENRKYIAIDLKSYYASVECVLRDLDPLRTNLVVADTSRTEKTICLAVSPSLKAFGIPGRARLFEVVSRVKEVNRERKKANRGREFSGISYDAEELKRNPSLELGYIAAPPQMALYEKRSTEIYEIYLKYIAPEDIHVYSIDEVFIDATQYLKLYGLTAREFAEKLVQEVYDLTSITATAGIGTNLYLAKIAMDIIAKHAEPDEKGARLAEIDEISYRRMLWNHRPITDFWRVGRGYATRLAKAGIYTMGDVARCSLGKDTDFFNEDLLYKIFGKNAELLIDHAWGYEPCTIADIKAYRPSNNSLCSGQVLQSPYSYEKTRIIVREMTDLLVLDLVDKGLVTDQMVLDIGYDTESLKDKNIKYSGEITIDHYGRRVPKAAHGSINLNKANSSSKIIIDAVVRLFEEIVDKRLLVRRLTVTANHVLPERFAKKETFEQLDLFTDYAAIERQQKAEKEAYEREKKMQKAILDIKKKFGKNAILRGTDLEEGATTIERNAQIGGHKA